MWRWARRLKYFVFKWYWNSFSTLTHYLICSSPICTWWNFISDGVCLLTITLLWSQPATRVLPASVGWDPRATFDGRSFKLFACPVTLSVQPLRAPPRRSGGRVWPWMGNLPPPSPFVWSKEGLFESLWPPLHESKIMSMNQTHYFLFINRCEEPTVRS